MRVFHFINEQYGLENIKMSRLKVSKIMDLNDPFELLSPDLSDKDARQKLNRLKEEISKTIGILCFSKSWSNPVQWSHYADKHQGLCLGFEIPDKFLNLVTYDAKRLTKEFAPLLLSKNDAAIKKLLTTKYAFWKYEKEVRILVKLENPDNKLEFTDFSEDIKLMEIIIGAKSKISRNDILEALGSERKDVQSFKTRLAFQSFSVVRNRDETLWI